VYNFHISEYGFGKEIIGPIQIELPFKCRIKSTRLFKFHKGIFSSIRNYICTTRIKGTESSAALSTI